MQAIGTRLDSIHYAPMGALSDENGRFAAQDSFHGAPIYLFFILEAKKGRFAALFSFHRAPMVGLRPKKRAASRPFLASTGY